MYNNVVDVCYEFVQVFIFLLQMLVEVVEGYGVDFVWLCWGLGFIVEDLQDFIQCIFYCQVVSMIQCVFQVLLEWGLGLWVGYQNVFGIFGLLGYVLLLCWILCDVFDIGVCYQYSLGGIVIFSVYQQGDIFFVEVECYLFSSEVQVFVIEEFFVSLLVYGCVLVSLVFELLGIEFIYVVLFYVGEYLCLLGFQVCFGCLYNCMVIVSYWLDMCLFNYNLLVLCQVLVLLEQESIQVYWKFDLVQVVEWVIVCDFSLGSQIERIFVELNMSSCILWCWLVEYGLIFEVLLEQV